jgi:hypothetical protein
MVNQDVKKLEYVGVGDLLRFCLNSFGRSTYSAKLPHQRIGLEDSRVMGVLPLLHSAP